VVERFEFGLMWPPEEQVAQTRAFYKEGRFPQPPPFPDGGLETAAPWRGKVFVEQAVACHPESGGCRTRDPTHANCVTRYKLRVAWRERVM
jgi:hypothetical protein